MFRRGLAILLCSTMLAGSLPETGFAAEHPETTETVEAETQDQENEDSLETEGDSQTLGTAVSETQTVQDANTETGNEETTETKTETTEQKETEEALKTETEEHAGASEEYMETVTQTTEMTETEVVTNPAQEDIAGETTEQGETEETTQETTETTETELTEEETTQEIENEETQSTETFGNEYVTISNVKVAYNKISFDYFKSSTITNIYINDSKNSKFIGSDVRGSAELSNLSPETEYRLALCGDSKKDVFYEFSLTTAECPFDVKYEVSTTYDDGTEAYGKILLSAEVAVKEGAEYEKPRNRFLAVRCYDENGKHISELDRDIYMTTLGKTNCVVEEPRYIFENKKYTFELWISEQYGEYYGDLRTEYAKVRKEITTLKSPVSDVDIAFTNTGSSDVNYTVTTEGYKESISGAVFFRLKGSNIWSDMYCSYFDTENGTATGEVADGLAIGVTYEYMVNVGGFVKTGEFTNGEAKLKWDMSCDVGALDVAVTFQIDEETKTQGAEYEVWGYYRLHASEDTSTYDFGALEGAENVYVSDYLYPDTEYDVEFGIWETLPDGTSNKYKTFETVRTKASAINTKITSTYTNGVEFNVAFDPSVRVDYLWEGGINAQLYVKEGDGKYKLIENPDNVWITGDINSESYRIYGLESNKSYEISFGYMDTAYDEPYYYEYGTMTFKTAIDDRTITIDKPEAGISSFKIRGTLKGSVQMDETYIDLLYRESGTDRWNYVNTSCDGENKFTLRVFHLTPGKQYDYAVGIEEDGFSYNLPDINQLRDVKQGTIILKEDDRSIEIMEITSLLDGISVKAKLLGNYMDVDPYCYGFMLFREKGKADASWWSVDFEFEDANSKETTGQKSDDNGEALKSGVTYEYKTCIEIPEKEEDYANLAGGGEFTYTRPADDRKLDVNVTADYKTANFAIALTGNSRAIKNVVTVFYREKGSKQWKKGEPVVIGCQSAINQQNYQIDSLESDKDYEYTVGLSNEMISDINDIVVDKKTGTFSTKDERKLTVAVTEIGYTYADFRTEVEGIAEGDWSTRVSLYTRDTTQQGAKWILYEGNVYGDYTTHLWLVSGLEQGKTYDYAFIISDKYDNIRPDSEAFNALSGNKKVTGTISTKKSDYKLEITENEKSVFDKEILNIKAVNATGFSEKNFDVRLSVRENESGDSVYTKTIPLNSIGYTAEAVITRLSEKTKYDVTAVLYAKSMKDGMTLSEQVAEAVYTFTTKAAAAPTELKADVTELYLNSWNTENQYYSSDVVHITVEDGFSNEVKWTSSNPDVAYASDRGFVYAQKPGEATITAESVLNPSAKAEVNVHVKNYGVVFTDTNTPSLYNSVYTLKNTNSSNIAYAAISEDGKGFQTVEAVGNSDNPGIAQWDKAKQCVVAKNVGSTTIVLESEGFKTDLYVTVYADSPDFDLKISPTEGKAAYPALKTDDGYQIAAGQGSNYYRISAEANPIIWDADYTIYDVITFTSSDTSVLTIDERGYVKGLKKGTATVSAAYDMNKIKRLIADITEHGGKSPELEELAKHTDLAEKTKTVTFDVRPLPTQSVTEVHVITNVYKTLGEVKTLGEGWSWRDPETPLYALPDRGNASYAFEAKYTGTEFYNYEGTVNVSLSTITGVDIVNSRSDVISKGGTDYAKLIVKPVVYGDAGLMEGRDYSVSFPVLQNITVTADAAGYKVTAGEKGKYTLKPEIKVGDTVVAAGNYTVTAVDGKLIDHIDIEPVADKNIIIKGSTIYFDSNAGVESFQLKAAAYDREGRLAEDTKLTWTINDKTVADIDAKTNGDRNVTVKMKGDGHAVIQVTAGDEAGAAANLKLEARNRKPRVEGDKATINTAYDYSTYSGTSLSARQYGTISVATVYKEDIESVLVVAADVEDGAKDVSGKALKEFELYEQSSFYPELEEDSITDYITNEKCYVIKPTNPDMAEGKYTAKLAVTTMAGFTYTYPLTITVINKEPKVSAKVSNTMNLFYLNDWGNLDITLEKNKSNGTDFEIERIQWSGEGFKLAGYPASAAPLEKTPNVQRCSLDGSKVKVTNGKPESAEGILTIKLGGVRKLYELPVKVKCSYKKPKLKTSDSMTRKNTSTIISSVTGGKSGSFSILADKKTLYLYGKYPYGIDGGVLPYNEIRCANDKVRMENSENGVNIFFTYSGTEQQFNIPLTIDSYNWREALTVTHKVKTVKPTAVLSNAKLTYNTKYDSQASTLVYFKDYAYTAYTTSGGNTYSLISAVDVAGADTASQELLTSGKLQIEYTSRGKVAVKLNTSKMGAQTPKGASYVLTPYCFDAATGENKPFNKLPLKITFTNKPLTAKVTGKGKIDLALYDDRFDDSTNGIAVTAKFANLSSGYFVEDAELIGEYSKYFTFEAHDGGSNPVYYIRISEEGRGRLKAGNNYNLSAIYTLKDDGGNRITVKSSNVLKVKPVQKAPKLTVIGDNRILYAASPMLYRRCEIRTPFYSTRLSKDCYEIESAYGFIDVNQDGKADIEAKFDPEYSEPEEGYAGLTIKLTDADAVLATAQGKAYTIPVTVKLVGRDGISKDAVANVKVIVKR